jgi:hypothetical protein
MLKLNEDLIQQSWHADPHDAISLLKHVNVGPSHIRSDFLGLGARSLSSPKQTLYQIMFDEDAESLHDSSLGRFGLLF